VADLNAQCAQLQCRLAVAVVVDRDKQAEFATTGQARGVSLTAIYVLLRVLLGSATPSPAKLGRFSHAAGRRAGPLLAVLDRHSRARARQIAADEIYSGRRPILMTIEQESLCWLGGRLADNCRGETWAEEFRGLTVAEQVTMDGGVGLRKGVARVSAEREQAGGTRLYDQRDHFHIIHRARRARRGARFQAVQAMQRAEKAQAEYDHAGKTGVPRNSMQGRLLNQAWAKAEQAIDRWTAQETADRRLQSALLLVTPNGELNTRAHAEAEVQAVLAGQTGDDWARARRLLTPEAFTFLDRVHEQLAALPVPVELRQAAVRAETLRRRPEALRGDTSAAAVARGVLLVASVTLSLGQEMGTRALELVRGVLDRAWRSSSLVEGVNSVVRMHQRRHKRLTQGLLDIQRLYWNTHAFRAGKRKGSSPYRRMDLVLPEGGWWALIKLTPEQLQEQLSALNPAA
jgi:DNA-binding transcriptional MerR regulator